MFVGFLEERRNLCHGSDLFCPLRQPGMTVFLMYLIAVAYTSHIPAIRPIGDLPTSVIDSILRRSLRLNHSGIEVFTYSGRRAEPNYISIE